MPDTIRPYAPPRAWPRPGASYSLGWIPATPADDVDPHISEPAAMPDAVKFSDQALASYEPDRAPPDPRDARRPGLRWVRAADLLQQAGTGLADRAYGPMSRVAAKMHAPVEALADKAKSAWAQRHEARERDRGEIEPAASQPPIYGPVISR